MVCVPSGHATSSVQETKKISATSHMVLGLLMHDQIYVKSLFTFLIHMEYSTELIIVMMLVFVTVVCVTFEA